jgi:aminoglycoside 6'-N-acetyltransferase I
MASAVNYVHPDKQPELWINEVGVSPAHRSRGIGAQLVRALLAEGKRLGCVEAWVLTERENAPALRLYASCGGVEASPDSVMFTFHLR